MNIGFVYDGIIRIGRLYISKIDNVETDQPLDIDQGILKSSGGGMTNTTFDYSENGKLKIVGTDLHLAVDSKGNFVAADTPQLGFQLKTDPGFYFQRKLYFNGESVFRLFGDSLVGLKDGSAESGAIEITYEDMIQPR